MASLDHAPKITDGIRSAPAAGDTPRQVIIGSLVAALLLALFASRGLQSWADAKGDSRLADLVGDAVERWSDGIERLGLTQPHDALRRAIRRIENTGWD